MQAVREDLRRVARLASVNKITQLSPEALEAACYRALSTLARHAPQAEPAALDSDVVKLATALQALEAKLLRLIEGRGTLAALVPTLAALCALRTACLAARHCSIQTRLQLVHAGTKLLLSSGTIVLVDTSFAHKKAWALVLLHLQGAQSLLELACSGPDDNHPELGAAAKKAFLPEQTLWLTCITAFLAEHAADSEAWPAHTHYACVCKQLFHGEPVPEHFDFSAVQDQTTASSIAIARVLLQRTLPAAKAAVRRSVAQQQLQQSTAGAVPAAAAGGGDATIRMTEEDEACKVLGWIGALCKTPSLRPAILTLVWQDMGSTQATAQQLMTALPSACPPSLEPFLFQWAWESATELLLLPFAAIEQHPNGSAQASCQEAAALQAASCLPLLAAAVRAAPASHREADGVLMSMCSFTTSVIQRVSTAPPAVAKWRQAKHCVVLMDAADAMLRTLPTLHLAQQAGEQLGQPTAAEQPVQDQQERAADEEHPAKLAARAAAQLSSQCLALLRDDVQMAYNLVQPDRRVNLQLQLPETVPDLQSLQDSAEVAGAAWRLHTTACRWVHWAVARGAAGDLVAWHPVLCQLGGLLETLDREYRDRWGTMAAHFAAVQAIAEAGGPLPDWPPRLAQQWAIHLAWLSTRLDEGWPLRLGEMLLEASSLLLQSTTSGTADADVTDAASAKLVLTDWLARLACSPPAMAALLPSGAFAQAIDALEAAGGMEQVIQIMAQASSGLVTAPSPKSPEWTAAHNVFTSLQQLALASRGGMLTPGQVADFKQRLHSEYLPALAAAATLMQRQREERPWIEQAQEVLEEGLAAATRSCAYLRCANLGGGGGPAAGQGTSSAKCSACREAWYCSTACSHADWRQGGHRRLCKAMAAWHQQQKGKAVEEQPGQLRLEEGAGQR